MLPLSFRSCLKVLQMSPDVPTSFHVFSIMYFACYKQIELPHIAYYMESPQFLPFPSGCSTKETFAGFPDPITCCVSCLSVALDCKRVMLIPICIFPLELSCSRIVGFSGSGSCCFPCLFLSPSRAPGKLHLGRAIRLVLASEMWVQGVCGTCRLWHLRASMPPPHSFSLALWI